MIPIPAYVDPAAWSGFVEMRRAMPKTKPFTARAATLILYELQRIKDAGHCPNAALDQSTLRGWADVYPPKDKPIERAASSAAEETRRQLDERTARQASPPPAELASVRKSIRRVA